MTSTMRKLGVGITVLTLVVAVFVPTIASAERRRGGHHDRDDNDYSQQECVPALEITPDVLDDDEGRRFDNNNEQSHDRRRHHGRRDICATATPATFDPSTCDALGTYTIVEAAGVDYTIDGEVVAPGTYTAANGTTVTIVAVAQEGYAFEADAVTSWTYTYNAPTDCETTPVVTTSSITPQVTAKPVGAVHAGAGGAAAANGNALLGLVASIGTLAFGIVRKFVA